MDILKLSVASRVGVSGRETLSDILTCLAKCNPAVAEMLLELCVTELEDVAADRNTGRSLAQPVVQESPHPYTDDTSLAGHVKIPGSYSSLVLHYNKFTRIFIHATVMS